MIGMAKRYVINLTTTEREALQQLVQRARVSGRKRLRAGILLRADEGLTDEEIADELGVGLRTVERVRRPWEVPDGGQRCCERGIEACLEKKPQENPSRPRKFDGRSEAELIRIACSPAPPGRARWTISLLADKLVELKVFDSVRLRVSTRESRLPRVPGHWRGSTMNTSAAGRPTSSPR